MFWIFGDSYSAYNNEGHCWQSKLKEHEPIFVEAEGGRSTYDSLRELQKRSSYDKVIFLLTDKTRLPFSFIDKPTHSGAAYDMYKAYKNGENIDDYCNEAEIGEGYEVGGRVYSNLESITKIYDTFNPEIKMWPFYTCLFLKWLNVKTLVLTTEKNVLEDIPYDWKELNDEKFKIVDTQLREVCGNEFHDGIIRQEIEQDRLNHLSYPNHEILYNIISNFFYDTNLSEEFISNIYQVDGEQVDKFIYD